MPAILEQVKKDAVRTNGLLCTYKKDVAALRRSQIVVFERATSSKLALAESII
jgi:hypothetical protein